MKALCVEEYMVALSHELDTAGPRLPERHTSRSFCKSSVTFAAVSSVCVHFNSPVSLAGTRICHGVAIVEAGQIRIELSRIVWRCRIECIGLHLDNCKSKPARRVLDSSVDGTSAMAPE